MKRLIMRRCEIYFTIEQQKVTNPLQRVRLHSDKWACSPLNNIPGKLFSLEHSSFNKLNLDYSVRLVSCSFQTYPF